MNVVVSKRVNPMMSILLVFSPIMLSSGAWAQSDGQEQDADRASSKRLGKKLIKESTENSSADIMTTILEMMRESSRRIELRFDVGEDTQAVQQRILHDLDEAIKQAASRLRPKKNDQKPQQGDERKRPKNNPKQSGKVGQSDSEGKDNQGEATPSSGKANAEGATGGRLNDSRQGWGNLPQRERDEIRQGAEETYLKRYREWIEEYYRALQDAP